MSSEGSAIEGDIERLREAYGPFPVAEERTTVPREALVECMSVAGEDRLGGVRTLLKDDGRALLVRYRENPEVWDLPGGSLDRHETHERAAERQVANQLGAECDLEEVFRARRQTFSLVEGGEGADGLWVYFEADAYGDDFTLAPEVLEARWFDEPPASTASPVRERFDAVTPADAPSGGPGSTAER